MSFRVINVSKDNVYLPDMEPGDEDIRLGVLDGAGKRVPIRMGYSDTAPGLNSKTGFADTITLAPGYSWGSDVAIKGLNIRLNRVGRYTVRIVITGTVHDDLYAQRMWEGRVSASTIVDISP